MRAFRARFITVLRPEAKSVRTFENRRSEVKSEYLKLRPFPRWGTSSVCVLILYAKSYVPAEKCVLFFRKCALMPVANLFLELPHVTRHKISA